LQYLSSAGVKGLLYDVAGVKGLLYDVAGTKYLTFGISKSFTLSCFYLKLD
jgi:hypothetical protein